VEAQARFGFSVNGFGVGDLVCNVNRASDSDVDRLVAEYDERYVMTQSLRAGGARRVALREAAAPIEFGMRGFLKSGGFHASPIHSRISAAWGSYLASPCSG
jgi:L-arabinose isomerase